MPRACITFMMVSKRSLAPGASALYRLNIAQVASAGTVDTSGDSHFGPQILESVDALHECVMLFGSCESVNAAVLFAQPHRQLRYWCESLPANTARDGLRPASAAGCFAKLLSTPASRLRVGLGHCCCVVQDQGHCLRGLCRLPGCHMPRLLPAAPSVPTGLAVFASVEAVTVVVKAQAWASNTAWMREASTRTSVR